MEIECLECLNRKNILTNIGEFLTTKEILNFSHCNKSIRACLNPESNIKINNKFLQSLIEKYFQFDEDFINKIKKNLSVRILKFNKNYKDFFMELNKNFSRLKNENIRKKVKDCFKIHLFLPSLRKENVQLEYEFSDIHLSVSYDMLFRYKCTNNYYSKFITKEYMLSGINSIEGNIKTEIKILKEGLYFEQELKNFNRTFNEFVNNDDYNEILLNVIEYNYKELECKYNNLYKHNNNHYKCNDIIFLLLWIVYMFIKYCDFVYYYMSDFTDDTDERTILTEFSHRHNEIINCALLLNSNFENVNIIINNYLIYYPTFNKLYRHKINMSQGSSGSPILTKYNFNSSERFSLYKLFFKIIKENVFQRLSAKLLDNKFKILIKNYCQEVFESNQFSEDNNSNNKFEDEDDFIEPKENESQRMVIEDECSDEEEMMEDIMDDRTEEKEPCFKEVLENYMNCQVDYTINEKNANAINHSELKVSEEYESAEKVLVNQFKEAIRDYIKEEKPCSEIFSIISRLTKSNGIITNVFRASNSLLLIRRTKKVLMKSCLEVLFEKGIEDYVESFKKHIKTDEGNKIVLSLSEEERLIIKEYVGDLDEFSTQKKRKITEVVQKEIERFNEILKEKCERLYLSQTKKLQIQNLVDEFSKCNGVEEVSLFKKMLWFYYRELGIYDEKNERIIDILEGKKMCQEDNSKPIYESKNLINGGDINFQNCQIPEISPL